MLKLDKEELEKLQAKYKLTEKEYEAYFNAVNLSFTTGKKSVDTPKLVFVAGQAGAGKSKLIPIVYEGLGYNAVVSDYDKVRSMHPKFEQASRECQNVHLALLPDADRANEDLRHYCRDHHLNLIYEGTMRGTKVFLEIAQEFKTAGYEVDLSLMSVPKLESYGSTLLRYATDLIQNNIPRWVPKEVHDQSYDNFIVTLGELQKRGLYDRADVYRRGREAQIGKPVKIYSTEVGEFADPIEAVQYGRKRYRLEAILDYPTKYSMVEQIFEEKSPCLIEKLKDWKELYKQEREAILEERKNETR